MAGDFKIGTDNKFTLLNYEAPETKTNTPLKLAINGIANKVFSKWIEYQIVREGELKKLSNEVSKYYDLIPEENIDDSKPGLFVKALEDSEYQLSDEELRDIFANLIAGTLDNRVNPRIKPSYSGILKELSSEEVNLINIVWQFGGYYTFFVPVRVEPEQNSYQILSNTLLGLKEYTFPYNKKNALISSNISLAIAKKAGLIDEFKSTPDDPLEAAMKVEVKKTIEYKKVKTLFEQSSVNYPYIELDVVSINIKLTPLGTEIWSILNINQNRE